MSTISTDTTSTITGATHPVKEPNGDNMIVSITRHRHSAIDTEYTYQLPLSSFETVKSSEQSFNLFLLDTICKRLAIDDNDNDHCIVWLMSETGQIAHVRSQMSFEAAVLDHKNANKRLFSSFWFAKTVSQSHSVL